MPSRESHLDCPICGYDCHSIKDSACPECGAKLVPSLASPNRLVVGSGQLCALICSSAALLIAIVVGMIFADVHDKTIASERDRVQQHMQATITYRGELQAWWMKLQAGEDPGPAPSQPQAQGPGAAPASVWLSAARASIKLFLLPALTAIAALVILWILAEQRRRPLRRGEIRTGKLMIYVYISCLLWIAVFGTLRFLQA